MVEPMRTLIVTSLGLAAGAYILIANGLFTVGFFLLVIAAGGLGYGLGYRHGVVEQREAGR